MRSVHFAGVLLTAVFFLSACNLPSGTQPAEDINALSTAAAQTVQAQLTLAAPLPTTTNAIPSPTYTVPAPTSQPPTSVPPTAIRATATSNCNRVSKVEDVSIPDGTILNPNQAFTKTWRLTNGGTCSWTPAYALTFSSGNSMSGPATRALTGNVDPGQSVDLSVDLTAPAEAGEYTGYYKLRDASGVLFSNFWVQIKVQDSSGGKFAVTSVSFTTTGGCGGFTARANITVNKAGTVTYTWVRSDGAADTVSHPPLEFDGAGSQSVSVDWNTTDPGAKWIDIYIDTPNHQQFGRASFNCP